MAQQTIIPARVGPLVYNRLTIAKGKVEAARRNCFDGNPQTVKSLIDDAARLLSEAVDAIVTGEVRELRRPVEVTEQLEQVEP